MATRSILRKAFVYRLSVPTTSSSSAGAAVRRGICTASTSRSTFTAFNGWKEIAIGSGVGLSLATTLAIANTAQAESETADVKTAYDGGWWRFRTDGNKRRHPAQRPDAPKVEIEVVEPEVSPNTIRVACVGDSITFGFDGECTQPTKLSMPQALEQISALSGKKVSSESINSMCLESVQETERLWNELDMHTFLLGGDHPDGPHHGLDIGLEVEYTAETLAEKPKKIVPMKQKLAMMAQRFGIELKWGWPWPKEEILPVALSTTVPQHLQQLLGDEYICVNFGVSGCTLMEQAHNPWTHRPEFQKAVAFNPTIVIINLGYNDANRWNWDLHKNNFVTDYMNLIDAFQSGEAKPKIYICIPTLPHPNAPNYDEVLTIRRGRGGLDSSIEAVSKLRDVELIDLEWAVNPTSLLSDFAHPDVEGAQSIAEAMHTALTTVKND